MKSLFKLILSAILVTVSTFTFARLQTFVKADTSGMVDPHLSGFNSIKIAGPFEVHLTQGAAESVKYDEPKDVAGRIIVKVDGSVLKIHNKHDNWGQGYKSWYSEKSVWHNHKRIVVYIIAKDLKKISVSGSGAIVFNEGIKTSALKLTVRGSGEMTGKIDVHELESNVSGSGHMQLSGNAESSKVRVIGSGNFKSPDLITSTSAAHVSGSGNAQVNASDKIDAVVHGSGVVKYTGAAKDIKRSTSGSGEINRM